MKVSNAFNEKGVNAFGCPINTNCSVFCFAHLFNKDALQPSIDATEEDGFNNKSNIYINNVPSEEFKKLYNKISHYLKSRGKNSTLAIKRDAILSYQDNFNNIYNKPVMVYGIENKNRIVDVFDLKIDTINSISGRIIIGDKLASYLDFPNNSSDITLISPLDGNFLVPYKDFNYIDANFSFNNSAFNQ